MSVHVSSYKMYFGIFFALMGLTALTRWIAFYDLGGGVMNNVVALAIAVTKAILVILFFMHVQYSTRLTKLVIAAAIFFLSLLIVITSSDYYYRGLLGVPGK